VTDRDFAGRTYVNGSAGSSGRPESFDDDLPPGRDWEADPSAGLVSLGFLKAAIRRSAFFCFVMTVAGLLIGGALYVAIPAPYQASATILITDGPYENGNGSAADDQAIAQSPTVGLLAMHKLGLRENVSTFLKSYLVAVNSERVLVVTFSAKSASAAVNGANAVATELLRFRVGLLEEQQDQVLAGLQQQLSLAKQKVKTFSTQVGQESGQRASPAQQSRLHYLRSELGTASGAVTSLEQSVTGFQATVPPATAAAVNGSRVLAAGAPLPRAHLKRILLYPVGGLVIGLAVGIAIVLIRAIISDRLRRRDDIANALGAPVRISTGPLRRRRRLSVASFRPGGAAARRADIGRVSAHLGREIAENERGADALAVVAVDDPAAAALPLVSLATSCTGQGKRVVLADLAPGAPAARLMGAGRPGVSTVGGPEAPMVVAVPDRGDVVPSGPLGRVSAWDPNTSFSKAVAKACARADLLLTLVSLDPAAGAEHLPTWAPDAVVVVTAGRSTWTRINAVGELVRLSGTRLVSAVLVGADRRDETLGEILTQAVGRHAGVEASPASRQDPGLAGRAAAVQSDGQSPKATQRQKPEATDQVPDDATRPMPIISPSPRSSTVELNS
jgi:capsular polysaccharide biosynthesis protein